jgi:hypothetical protein
VEYDYRGPHGVVEEAGYRPVRWWGAAVLYSHPEPRLWGLAVAPMDWPMHRLFQAPGGVGVTPREGLTLEGVMAVREPGRLEVVGAASVERLAGGALRARPVEGRLHPWGLLDPYTPRPGSVHPWLTLLSALAARLRPARILLIAAYTRPHSRIVLRDLPPQPAVAVDICGPGGPLTSAWAGAPGWLRVACVEAPGLPGLPGAGLSRGALERALGEVEGLLGPR